MTGDQKLAAQAIINIFETSQVRGNYGAVTVIPGDTGHLTYGRSQTTLSSGNLAKLVERYCGVSGCRHAALLRPYLAGLAQKDIGLDSDPILHNRLRVCADDPLMREVQDAFFEDTYWNPAFRAAARMNLTLPLSVAVVYDGFVQGSFSRIAEETTNALGAPNSAGEKPWIARYVDQRLSWLANHKRADLRATVYRMQALHRLIAQDLWNLDLPFVVRGCEVSTASLAAPPRGCFEGPAPGTRALALQTPILSGLDVRLLQLGLSEKKLPVVADGLFGKGSVDALKAYQHQQGLPATGAAMPDLVRTLAGH